jgi:putative sigma-54 modulation protein
MNITVQGTNMNVSPGLRDFVERKLQDCFRPFGEAKLDAVQVDVELEKAEGYAKTTDMYRVEANVAVPGKLIRVEESSDDIRAAVVKMKETLTREIRRWRTRKIARVRKGARQAKRMLRDQGE